MSRSFIYTVTAPVVALSVFLSAGSAGAAPGEQPYRGSAAASSTYNAELEAGLAVDGSDSTRWCSAQPYGDTEWLQVDLGSKKPVGRVEILWEIAYARGYTLSVSDDAENWKEIFRGGKGNGARDVLNDLNASGRYLRLDCLERGTHHGFSIWEVRAFARATANAEDVVPHDPTYIPKPPKVTTMEFKANKKYLIIPISNSGGDEGCNTKLWLTIGDRKIGPYDLVTPRTEADVDWYGNFPLEHFQGSRVKVRLDGVTDEVLELIKQSDTIPGEEGFYKEAFRPQFHFSAKTGWLNDPNGLIYYKGEYHMYYQHNPFSVKWGNMSWGHATSKDLIHWEEKPTVLFPDADGTCFSGAAFIDEQNQLGLKSSAEDVIVAFYLRTNIGLAYAYSNDGGYSFTEYENNPVLSHAGARIDTPRPLWHEPTQRWVCPTYDFYTNDQGKRLRCVGIYSSADLKEWRFESRVEQDKWGDELCGCVDFFEFPVHPPEVGRLSEPSDGLETRPTNKKWVMILIDGSYIIGDFDGKTFYNLEGKPAITKDRIRSLVVDHNYYATMTWHNMPNDRRVQITWMHRRRHFPGMPYGEQMTLPSELTLHSTDEGLRLRMNPIKEFESLRTKTHTVTDESLGTDSNPLSGVSGELFDLEVEFEPAPGSETRFDMRGIPVTYVADTQTLSCGPAKTKLAPIDGKIHLRIIQDRTCIETYGNRGRVYIPVIELPQAGNQGLKATCLKGEAKLHSLQVHELRSAWK
jgi:sucrose-6-phosphate hydrolase SacC (GH32 family)